MEMTPQLNAADVNWTATDEYVAIKAVSWKSIRASRNRLSEDFIKEVAALQHVSKWHERELPNTMSSHGEDTRILPAEIIMSSETHLYIVMLWCGEGSLCERVARAEGFRLSEEESRFWFRQILTVSVGV